MALINLWRKDKPGINRVSGSTGNALPIEMLFKFLPNNQVVWYADNSEELMNKGYLDNHAVFTIVDWLCKKVASAPPILYEVRDKKSYNLYRALLKDATPESVQNAKLLKLKALVEVENKDITRIFDTPNELMSWFEFIYGSCLYKNLVGAMYWMGVRSGSVMDPTKGKIRELWLPPAHHMVITSGGMFQPISKYHLVTNPEDKIDAANVHQIRNFSPRYETPTQHLYGLSKLYPARKILQKHNEGVVAEVDLFQKKGIRDIMFPKNLPDNTEVNYEQFQKTRDDWNKKINESGPGSILINDTELGSLRVGFSPDELGILESQKLTKSDFCALFHIPDIIFGWNEQTTFNNLAESRKIAFTDAVLPELEAIKDGLNTFLLKSYDDTGKYVIDFDLEYFPEMQDDNKEKVAWLDKIPLTANEYREAFRYDRTNGPNDDKIMVNSGKKLLDDLGLESFSGVGGETDPDLIDDEEEDKPAK